jgi:hypothetical protein
MLRARRSLERLARDPTSCCKRRAIQIAGSLTARDAGGFWVLQMLRYRSGATAARS